jgi:hypothetical protein
MGVLRAERGVLDVDFRSLFDFLFLADDVGVLNETDASAAFGVFTGVDSTASVLGRLADGSGNW